MIMDSGRRVGAGLALAALLAACGTSQQPVASGSVGAHAVPSPSRTDSATDTASGTAAPVPIGSPIEPSSVVHVIADELRLRAEPSTAGDLVATMPRGHVARVASGPVDADGFRWWELIDLTGSRGWAAEGDGADPWLATPLGATGEPLLRLSYGCDVTGPIRAPATTILTDGTVILAEAGYEPGDPAPPDWLTGRLSAAGIEHVRENIVGSPYLQTSAEYTPEPLPGAEPPGHGACLYEFSVGTEDIVVTAVGWFGDAEEAEFWQPSPERKTLTQFAEGLISLDDVLADELWTAPPSVPYLAPRYSLVRTESPAGPPEPSGPPRHERDPVETILGDPDAQAQIGPCWEIDVSTTFDVASALGTAEPPWRFQAVGGTGYVVDATHFGLIVVPQTPAGEPSCADIAAR